ncbi:MAG: UDP-N-acetylmuramoyl-L-alanyl-D-glutamate--2,6-diaminopimelate ligase [Patescibacteria group bacterium]
MKLSEILTGLDWRCAAGRADLDPDITGIAHDSHRVQPGNLFVCLTGRHADGRAYIPDALNNGARAVLVERAWEAAAGETVVAVDDARKALAVCCANWHGNPARELTLIGITGTNGKTTTAFFLDSILGIAGAKTGLLGTVQNKIGDRVLPCRLTTPEPVELHGLFREMVEAGAAYCTMEVSSHALDQDRVFGLEFAAGVFTNLSFEHLEYHADLDEYLAVKSRLFEQARYAVLNRDDASYHRLRRACRGPVLDYGFADGALVRGEMLHGGPGAGLAVHYRGESVELHPALPGRYNACNALAAAAAALALGFDLPAVAAGVARLRRIPGRFEEIEAGQPFRVIVDYAHTPDGLAQFLTAVRESTEGRVVLIFGARGGRDRAKRPMMGSIAARLTDYCYLTADSPNDEPPDQILRDLELGFLSVKNEGYEVVPERKTAMKLALEAARPRDAVVATGRGHETEYRVGGEVYQLRDGEAFRELLGRMAFMASKR